MVSDNGIYEALSFERPILELEKRIFDLESFSKKAGIDLSKEINELKHRCDQKKKEIYSNLTPWQRIQITRNLNRPDTVDYISALCTGFVELHGDRAYRDDKAIICGLCQIEHYKLVLIGTRKGGFTRERVEFNFGSPHPEGYRKALNKMRLAEKFKLPIVTMINTPGAYPGIGAEERGQANIIAQNIMGMSQLKTPIISVIIGEGGSGGALAICVADKLVILEHAYLSVISPEGCAAILWRDSSKAHLAAEMLHLVPEELLKLGIVDEIIPEPLGGAHRDPKAMAEILKKALLRYLDELCSYPVETLLERRYQKYRKIGIFIERQKEQIQELARQHDLQGRMAE